MNNKQNLDGTANQDSRTNENQPTEPTSSRNHANQEQTNQDTYNYSMNNNMDTETTTEHNRDNNSLQDTTDTDQTTNNRIRHDNNNNGTDNNNNGNIGHKINRTKCIQQLLPQYDTTPNKINEAWGASIHKLPPTTFRIYFQNINGLQLQSHQSKWQAHLEFMKKKGSRSQGLRKLTQIGTIERLRKN
jgi:hypothetical protein